MKYSCNVAGLGEALVGTFKIGATVVAGQVAVLDTSLYGNITDPAVSSSADVFGVTLGAGTYSTTQGTGSSSANIEVEVVYSPLAAFEAVISGSATADTALSASTSNFLTNSTLSSGGTVISSTSVGTEAFDGGVAIAVSGNNKGAVRTLTSHSDNTSRTVTVPFDYALAANDKFLVLPYGPGTVVAKWTTDFTQLDPTAISTATAACLKVLFNIKDESAPEASALMVFRDHLFNPLS